MHLRRTKRLGMGAGAAGLTIALAVPASAADSEADGAAPTNFGPQNVIFLVGDGMGYNHIDAASLYEHGTSAHQVDVDPESGEVEHQPGETSQVYEDFPVEVGSTTFSDGQGYDVDRVWTDFDYVSEYFTDSAAAGTALATGVRTYNNGLGVDPDGMPVKNLTERAQELGKASGVVSDVPISHATPGAFVAHNADRNNYGSIAREMLWEHSLNVIMGTGHPHYDDDAEERDEPVYEYLDESEFTALKSGETQFDLVETAGEIGGLATDPNPPEHVVGMPQVRGTLQYDRSGDDRDEDGNPVDGAMPYDAPENEGVPTLAEMTDSALNVLDNASDEGMFLMVEGGAIDWAGHDNSLNRHIEEQMAFNDTVEAVVDWVERESSWSETLVVVTADHETGYLAGPEAGPGWDPLTGVEGALPDVSWHSGNHTNALVPVFAKGPGATRLEQYATGDDLVRGAYLENIDIPETVFDFWGRD